MTIDRRTFQASITINGVRHRAIETTPNIDDPVITQESKRSVTHKLIDYLIATGEINKIITLEEVTP